jgi:transcription elongation factor GreA
VETKKVPVTRDGLERLKQELDELRDVRRPQIIAAIAEARSHGDLRENAAYDAARHDQAMNEKRIGDLEALLRNAVVVDEGDGGDGPSDVVQVGSTVVVTFEGEADEESYTIVGAIEAKPALGRISNESPIGKALLGKRIGQVASVVTPGGTRRLTVKRIER